uniref:Centromere protein U n=1 Tax=Anolis carolinensis TaxID=28377 RepID=G1KB03_ANOCA
MYPFKMIFFLCFDSIENLNRKEMPKRKAKDSKKGPRGHEVKLQCHKKPVSSDVPDVSSILKVPGIDQTDEFDNVFDPPLHSTAVFDCGGEEEEEEEEGDKDLDSEADGSTSNSSDSESEKRNRRESNDQHSTKSRVARKDPQKDPLMKNTMSRESAKAQRKQKKASAEMEEDESDDPHLAKMCVPKGKKKRGKRVTEYEVILEEFDKVTEKYKQGVELKACRKAIDSFYTGFRDHLLGLMTGAEELKKTKLKNMKLVKEANQKRRRLIDVKEEVIKTDSQLKKLQREHAELEEKISSLRNARQLITDLKDLQQKYAQEREKNPQEDVLYGISSLPALLVESQRILGAEGHIRNINKRLQQVLNVQKES